MLDKFLHKHYPSGGEIDFCSPEVWPESDSAWTKLRAFVQDPLYTHHPHRDTLIAACSGISDVGKSGGGAGQKGQGFGIVAGFVRLAKVLRPPVTQRAQEQKIRAESRRRTKSILTVGATAPPGTVARVKEPQLEAIVGDITVEEHVEDEDEDEDDVEDIEASQLDATQTQNTQTHVMKLKAQSEARRKSGTKPTPIIQVPGSSPPPTDQARKRGREVSPSTVSKQVVRKRFRDVRHLPHDFLQFCSAKYRWNYRDADSDDEVQIEEDASAHSSLFKKPRSGRTVQPAKRATRTALDPEDPDADMLFD